ncbi:TetR family transcriptional regulator [Arthrobacter sp. lap29]|uniref:TetR/AcrR family transcriptional regulator n=1 Tax=Arthrobacter sp. lap29 TaxID=3056122 RepID=UPI0028F70C56|nr:TetR family transcriptional regulator [Arthrobacter sp. lap29]
MTESAKLCQAHGLRARKREATRSAITKAARIFTAQSGLNGFTIEQLCEEVGVSRRTFFNYFPSKEDAIIGYLQDEFPADAMAVFLACGKADKDPEGNPAGEPWPLSTTLVQDLFTLACAMTEQMDFSRGHIQDLLAAMKKEPQLMIKVIGSAHAREQEFAELIAQREQLPVDDPMARMAAALFGTCSQRASMAFFSEDNTSSYACLLAANITTAQKLFTLSHTTFEGSP